MNDFISGWTYNEERILAAEDRIQAAGFKFSFSDDRPQMKGHWARKKGLGFTRVLAQDDEMKLRGAWREPNSQLRGTCVGQGSSRAIEDVQISRLADKAIIGDNLVKIAGEIMYGYMRNKRWGKTHDWGCNCKQCPDGLQGADAAEFYQTIGCIPRKNYADIGVDLSKPREDLSITWNNTGVPKSLIEAAGQHKIICHTCRTWDDLADAIAGKNWGHVCLQMITNGTRTDQFGCCEPTYIGPQWGHCTECCGVVVLPTGETAFIFQQSWGSAGQYPEFVETASGRVKLRPKSYAMRKSRLESLGTQVERISCDIPEGVSFR